MTQPIGDQLFPLIGRMGLQRDSKTLMEVWSIVENSPIPPLPRLSRLDETLLRNYRDRCKHKDARGQSEVWQSNEFPQLRAKHNEILACLRQIDSDLAFVDYLIRHFDGIDLDENELKAYKGLIDRKNALRQRKEEIVNYCKTIGITVPVTAVIPEELPSRRAKDDEVVEV